MKADELKKMSPEERIRLLRQLEQDNKQKIEERKEEIEQARKMLRESEDEIDRREELKKQVPIPQVQAVSIEHLFGAEEKQVYATKRFVEHVRKIAEEIPPAEIELEEKIKDEEPQISEREQRQYQIQVMQRPTEEFYGSVLNVYQQAVQQMQETGQMTDEMREQVRNLYVEQREREKADREGVYNIPASMEEGFNVAKGLVGSLMEWYRG